MLHEYSTSRRTFLQAGTVALGGLAVPGLLAAEPSGSSKLTGALASTFGAAKSVIFLWLQGGPPQHETFDPKPDAPVDIRGPFRPIATNVPGVRFCELLPRTARHAGAPVDSVRLTAKRPGAGAATPGLNEDARLVVAHRTRIVGVNPWPTIAPS